MERESLKQSTESVVEKYISESESRTLTFKRRLGGTLLLAAGVVTLILGSYSENPAHATSAYIQGGAAAGGGILCFYLS